MWTYGISTGSLARLPRRRVLDGIAKAGFTRVEIAANPDDLDGWTADLTGMQRDLAARGLTAPSMHLPTSAWNVADPDDAVRDAAISAARDAFKVAAAIGASVVVCHPNKPHATHTPDRFAENSARSRDALAILADEAQTLGLLMAVENLPARHTARPGSTVKQVMDLIEGLGDHVGICLDAGHSTANGLSPADEARQARSHLLALHIQDNDGSGEDQHLIPGDGVTDWEAFREALQEIGFTGLRTFETGMGDDIEASLARLAAMRRAWMEE